MATELKSQLDTVLALEKLEQDMRGYVGPIVSRFDKAVHDWADRLSAIRAAVGGVGETVAWWREDHVCHAHELTTGDALAGGYKPCVIKCEDCAWNASLCDTHGAVGGEAVAAAWMLRRKRDDFVRGCYATKPTAESMEFAELDGDYYTPLYASPPATVGVGATTDAFHDGVILALQVLNASGDCGNADYVELVNCCGLLQLVKRAKVEDMMELSGLATYLQDSRVIRDAQSNPELAALIGERA